jgi:hypothetical protein
VGFSGKRDQAKQQADTIAALRSTALRAISRLDHPDGPRADINPHTASLSSYVLASMLTFDFRGDPVSEDVSRVVHTIVAGKPERREAPPGLACMGTRAPWPCRGGPSSCRP